MAALPQSIFMEAKGQVSSGHYNLGNLFKFPPLNGALASTDP